MKLTLFLMSRKGLHVLNAIIAENLTESIALVITSRDNNMQNDYYDEIIETCKLNNISFRDRKEKVCVETEYSLAISWRWMINLQSNQKLIVLHDSLLPKYRGFSPLVNMLLNKEPIVGVTALIANKEYDCGDIVGQLSVNVAYPLTINNAIEIISPLYERLVCDILNTLSSGQQLNLRVQDNEEATYSLWRDEDDYRIDWSDNSGNIIHKIHCVGYPFKGASTLVDGVLYRIHDAECVPDVHIENRICGKVIFIDDGMPVVVCGTGLIRILKMTLDDGMNALPLKKFRVRFE